MTKLGYSTRIFNESGDILYLPAVANPEAFQQVEPPDPYTPTAYAQYPLGSKLERGEEVYRYALCGGTAVEIAALCQSVVPLAGHINEAIDVPAVGDYIINFTPNTATTDDLVANELVGGYIFIYDGTGEGAKYRIASHPAITGATSGAITLLDPIRIAPAAASVATVMHSKFYKFIITPSPATATPCGWTVSEVTASYYCWLQTKGPLCSLIDSGGTAVVMGQPCVPSYEDDGAVQMFDPDVATEPNSGVVGWIMEIGADAAGGAATYGFVYANLE